MAEDMIARSARALLDCCDRDGESVSLDEVPLSDLARAALLAALDLEDEAMVESVAFTLHPHLMGGTLGASQDVIERQAQTRAKAREVIEALRALAQARPALEEGKDNG